MQYPEHVIILAAGIGSRLGMNTPKCLVEIHDKKIINYQLNLLKDFQNIRIVIGFKEEEVIEHVNKIRRDIIFVRNDQYLTTTNITSLILAVRYLNKPFILLDGDIIINKQDFCRFIEECRNSKESIVGVTKHRSQEAVFVNIENGYIHAFSTDIKSNYEWCGIAYIHDFQINLDLLGYIYKLFEDMIPIKAFELDVYEIDTPIDYALATKMITDSNF